MLNSNSYLIVKVNGEDLKQINKLIRKREQTTIARKNKYKSVSCDIPKLHFIDPSEILNIENVKNTDIILFKITMRDHAIIDKMITALEKHRIKTRENNREKRNTSDTGINNKSCKSIPKMEIIKIHDM